MELFDRSVLEVRSLSQRRHDMDLSAVAEVAAVSGDRIGEQIRVVAGKIAAGKERGGSVIVMMGGHVIKSGMSRYVIDLMERGYISCAAVNGSVMIHDFELARIGGTTESVARYISEGQFGLWKETSQINDIINAAYEADSSSGMGEAVGRHIAESDMPNKAVSVLAAGYRLGVPVTVHVGIGYDIIHEHANCSGAATGALSYNDFLRFVGVVQNLEGGVVMNFGSAVCAPEVYLKALSMARNAARLRGEKIAHFTTLVCDLVELPEDLSKEAPKDEPAYYFRPFKTMLIRTVADGGESFYVKAPHNETIPALWTALREAEA
jgi:hypothetical protein